MNMTIERECGDRPRRFRILHGEMLAVLGIDTREIANPNVCFATSTMGARAEEPEKSERGGDVPTKCASCGVENQTAAKFCMGCGESMATKPIADDEPAPSSKSKPGASTDAPPKMQAPAKMDASASLASILGATGTSDLAIKTAAIALRQVRDTAAGVTGKTRPGEIVGGLLTMPERIEQADRAAASDRKRAETSAKEQRWTYASRLNKLGLDGWPRGNIFADKIEGNARVAVGLQPMIASMDLDVLKGMVEGFEKSAPKRGPFEASRERAEAGAGDDATRERIDTNAAPRLADGKPTAAQIERAKKDPTVLRMFHAQGNARTLDVIAEQYIINAAKNGVSLGGAP